MAERIQWENISFILPPSHSWQIAVVPPEPLYGYHIVSQGAIVFDSLGATSPVEQPEGMLLSIIEFVGTSADWGDVIITSNKGINPDSIQSMKIADSTGIVYSPFVPGVGDRKYYALNIGPQRLLIISSSNASDERYAQVINTLMLDL